VADRPSKLISRKQKAESRNMKVICAWSKKVLQWDGTRSGQSIVSHGICLDCMANLVAVLDGRTIGMDGDGI